MKFLNRIERSLGRYAVPHLTLVIVFLQSLAYVLAISAMSHRTSQGVNYLSRLELLGSAVLQGEVWRLLTFMVIPPVDNPLFFFFAMYLLFLFGTALENQWGEFRYNIFLLVGWAATVAVAFIWQNEPVNNRYLMESIFLAFAFLYPDFELLLFFIFPVKVKYLALLTWIFMVAQFAMGDWLAKGLIVAAVLNFLIFFHEDLWQMAKLGRRRLSVRPRLAPAENTVFHRCTTCGVTEKSDPRMEFRYCPDCAGTPCYCILHIHAHPHIPDRA